MDAPREMAAAMYDFLEVPDHQRMSLEEISHVPAEPCTLVHYQNGVPVPGGISSPVSETDVAEGEVSQVTAATRGTRRRQAPMQ